MFSIIVLEDEPVLREELTEFLKSVHYRTKAVGTVRDFFLNFVPHEDRIALIDLGLPDGEGMDLIRELRQKHQRLGIIVLTARSGIDDKIAGLTDGADHFLPKSVNLAEIGATISALTRRLGLEVAPRWVLRASPPQLVAPGRKPLDLSSQDFKVLQSLALTGELVTRNTIVRALDADIYDYDQRRLDTQINRLRRKAETAWGISLPITTVRNVGFRFHEPIEFIP